jgi:hypothetical protein
VRIDGLEFPAELNPRNVAAVVVYAEDGATTIGGACRVVRQ